MKVAIHKLVEAFGEAPSSIEQSLLKKMKVGPLEPTKGGSR